MLYDLESKLTALILTVSFSTKEAGVQESLFLHPASEVSGTSHVTSWTRGFTDGKLVSVIQSHVHLLNNHFLHPWLSTSQGLQEMRKAEGKVGVVIGKKATHQVLSLSECRPFYI